MTAVEIIDQRHVTPVIFAFGKTCFCTINSADINEVSDSGKCVLSIGPSEASSDDNRVNGMFSPSDRSMQDSIEAHEDQSTSAHAHVASVTDTRSFVL
jgi:hypothetical protein